MLYELYKLRNHALHMATSARNKEQRAEAQAQADAIKEEMIRRLAVNRKVNDNRRPPEFVTINGRKLVLQHRRSNSEAKYVPLEQYKLEEYFWEEIDYSRRCRPEIDFS